jgi:outer membrane lipoprotein SlyB
MNHMNHIIQHGLLEGAKKAGDHPKAAGIGATLGTIVGGVLGGPIGLVVGFCIGSAAGGIAGEAIKESKRG